MNKRRSLLILVFGCVVLAGIIADEFFSSAAAPIAPIEATVPAPADTGPASRPPAGIHSPEQVTTALTRPLFSPTRRPADAKSAAVPADSDLTDVRLTAIVIEPNYRLALFAVTGSKPLVVKEGEALQGWQVDKIQPREISLTRGDTTKTLQPKLDPSLVPAAPPTPPNPAPRPGQPAQAGPAPMPGQPNPVQPAPATQAGARPPTVPFSALPRPPNLPQPTRLAPAAPGTPPAMFGGRPQ